MKNRGPKEESKGLIAGPAVLRFPSFLSYAPTRSSHGKKKDGQVAQDRTAVRYVGIRGSFSSDTEKDRNAERRELEGGGSPILCVGWVGARVVLYACMWVCMRMGGCREALAGGQGRAGSGWQGWTRRFDGGSLMPEQSNNPRPCPCLHATLGHPTSCSPPPPSSTSFLHRPPRALSAPHPSPSLSRKIADGGSPLSNQAFHVFKGLDSHSLNRQARGGGGRINGTYKTDNRATEPVRVRDSERGCGWNWGVVLVKSAVYPVTTIRVCGIEAEVWAWERERACTPTVRPSGAKGKKEKGKNRPRPRASQGQGCKLWYISIIPPHHHHLPLFGSFFKIRMIHSSSFVGVGTKQGRVTQQQGGLGLTTTTAARHNTMMMWSWSEGPSQTRKRERERAEARRGEMRRTKTR
jgi:hypothetical protein